MTVAAARGDPGDVLWEDQLDKFGGNGAAFSVAVGAGIVHAAGEEINVSGNSDFLVRSYDAESGALLWEDQFDKAGRRDFADAILRLGNRVYAGGLARIMNTRLFVVRAYDALTGALLWDDQSDPGGQGFSQAGALAGRKDRIFASGVTRGAPGNFDFLVRAYDAATGALLWQDQVDRGIGDSAGAVAATGGQVFAGGSVGDTSFVFGPLHDFIIRAYRAKTGALLWEDQFDYAEGGDFLSAIAADNDRVFAVGGVQADPFDPTTFDLVVRAYDAETGNLLWSDQVNVANQLDLGADIATKDGRVFVSGTGGDCIIFLGPGGNCDQLVRAYDAETGSLLWANQIDKGGGNDLGADIAPHGDQIFVSGTGGAGCPLDCDFIVRAFDAATGALLWEDQSDTAGGDDEALALAVSHERVFAAGFVTTQFGDSDFIVRAYDGGNLPAQD